MMGIWSYPGPTGSARPVRAGRLSLIAIGVVLALAACGGSESGSNGRGAGVDPQGQDQAQNLALVTKADSAADASRFLTQATFGPTPAGVESLAGGDLAVWLETEFGKSQTASHLDYWNERVAAAPGSSNTDWVYQSFWRGALAGDDALRQRVAFALSQIFVVSLIDTNVSQHPRGVASYYDMLGRNAFGNFRTLLEDVALHPMMGLYLSHLRNRGDGTRVPDENFAREVMQLFTIGLFELNADGSRKRGADGQPIDTYGNDDVTGLAAVFTGWSWAGPDTETSRFNGGGSPGVADRVITPMQPYPQFHALGAKRFLGTSCPGETMPRASLNCALDRLFAHSNVGPFIGRQLIQRLVTSNPSPGYVARVSAAFADNGQGVRGDMKAVLRRILLDPEARDALAATDPAFGKPREPLLRFTALMRATGATSASAQYRIQSTDDPVNSIGQTALRSPSVFNFWRPGYTPPNSGLAARDLVAPELQAVNETSVAGYVNVLQSVIQNGIGSSNDVKLDLAALQAIAHDADALINRVDLLLLAGQLQPASRVRIRDVVSALVIPAVGETAIANARRDRARIAVFLAAASPEFQTQR